MKTEPIDWSDPKYKDPMEELYAIRRHISAMYDHDVRKISDAAQKKAEEAKALGMTYAEYCLYQLRLRQSAAPVACEDAPPDNYK